MPYQPTLAVAPAKVYPPRPSSPGRPAAAPSTSPSSLLNERIAWETAVNNPTRKMGFYFGVTYVFLRFSMLHESIAMLLHINTYLALLTGIPGVILSVAGGGMQRIWESKVGRLWMGFVCLMIAALPFSSWLGQSVNLFSSYIKSDFPVLFIVGGMILTWKELKLLLSGLAISAVCTLAMEKMFSGMDDAGRVALTGGGTIANSNDYAAHLLMLLPFLLWVVLSFGFPYL